MSIVHRIPGLGQHGLGRLGAGEPGPDDRMEYRQDVPACSLGRRSPDHPDDLGRASSILGAAWEQFVIKPSISAGGRSTARYASRDSERALSHVQTLHEANRPRSSSPYMTSMDHDGELDLVFFNGTTAMPCIETCASPQRGHRRAAVGADGLDRDGDADERSVTQSR